MNISKIEHEKNNKWTPGFEWYKKVYANTPEDELINLYESQTGKKAMKEIIGDNSIIRSGTIIYPNVKIGNNFKTGHNVLIRDEVEIGDNVLIGTNVVIEGRVKIGNNVSIQTGAYVPTDVIIEDNVFIGPHVVMTNDKYPIREPGLKIKESLSGRLAGPILRKGASLGANCTILPGVEIGEGAMVAAGAVVTKDVGAWKLATGVPAKIVDLKDDLKGLNSI